MKIVVDSEEIRKYGPPTALILGYYRAIGDKLITYKEAGNSVGLSGEYTAKLTNRLIKAGVVTKYRDDNKVYSFEIDESMV